MGQRLSEQERVTELITDPLLQRIHQVCVGQCLGIHSAIQ